MLNIPCTNGAYLKNLRGLVQYGPCFLNPLYKLQRGYKRTATSSPFDEINALLVWKGIDWCLIQLYWYERTVER